jgi:hypothetical protein
MQALRQDMLTFCQQLSGVPSSESMNEEEKKYQDGLWSGVEGGTEWNARVDWKVHCDSYRSGRFNDWVYQVYESAVQLLKELTPENTDLIEGRYRRLKKYYYEMKNQPTSLYGGAGSTYEKAFNKKYYAK